jgi:tripartite-type tricarboxylate transporter receptor subunit TctC
VDDFSQVVTIGHIPLVVFAHPAFPPRNPAELVAYAKANPGKINWGSSGTGGSPHFGLLILQAATGIDVTHVPFKGSAPALVAMAGGQIQALHSSTVTAEAMLNGKRIKPVAAASAKRLAALPDVPTFAEMGFPNAESSVWFGMAAPPRTPRAIVAKLNAEVNRVLQSADSIRHLRNLGLEVIGGSPEEATRFVKRDATNVARFIREGKLTAE